MRGPAAPGLTALLVLALTLPLSAQDAPSDDAVFAEGAFDQAVAQGQASESQNKLVWLGGVSLASTTNLVVPSDRSAYGSRSQFSGKGFLKASNPTAGALFASYSFTHDLWASSDDPALTAGYEASKPNPAPVYQLSEFHLSFDAGKVVFFRLGSQLVDWGASAVWSPADFLNRKSADPNAPLDTRAGKPGLRVHVPLASGNLFLFADASRSMTASGGVRDLTETGSLGLKADATLAGWNIGVVGNFGKTSDPRLGLTASGALFGVDLWGEAGSVLPLGGRAFTWAASLGGEKSFGVDSEWTLRAEGFWNPEGQDDRALAGPAIEGFVPFYWGKVYGYAEAVKKNLAGPSVTGSLSATANLSDRSASTTASLRTAFPGTIPLSVYAQYNCGPQDREFTRGTGGPALTLGLRSVLEF